MNQIRHTLLSHVFSFFYRCCKDSEVLPSSSNHKQKGNTTKAGTSHTIRCEPNTLNQTSYAQPGGLSEEYQRNGGSITKRNRLYRQTSFTCHHNKKWASTAIAKPNSEFKKKEILGHLSDNGVDLIVKFNPKLNERNITKDFEIPLTNFEDYCVSIFNILIVEIYKHKTHVCA